MPHLLLNQLDVGAFFPQDTAVEMPQVIGSK